MEDLAGGRRRGVGTTSQCVTGRLATLEEIVDWQPYDRVAWRLAVPDLGPIEAVTDLEPVEGGTRVRLRWAQPGESAAVGDIERIRVDKAAAFERLSTLLRASMPVISAPVASVPAASASVAPASTHPKVGA